MIKHFCSVNHNPPESYGDCFRACLASIFDVPEMEDVPNFADGGAEWEEMLVGVRAWLRERGHDLVVVAFNAVIEDVFAMMSHANAGAYYLLMGGIEGGGHIVVCRDGEVVHNPAWYPTRFDGPLPTGQYVVAFIVPSFMREP